MYRNIAKKENTKSMVKDQLDVSPHLKMVPTKTYIDKRIENNLTNFSVNDSQNFVNKKLSIQGLTAAVVLTKNGN